MTDPLIVVSVSGGKDSTATLLLALERFPPERIRAVFADTGNEHQLTYDYVQMLNDRVHPVHRLRQDFTEWWWRRRDFVRDKWPEKMARAARPGRWEWRGNADEEPAEFPGDTFAPKDPRQVAQVGDWWWVPGDRQWTDAQIAEIRGRVLAALEKGPTGNPYLDLCIIKGMFPSRRAQFCTQYLKTEPLVEYQLGLIEQFGPVESWQGVRADESEGRSKAPEREEVGGGLSIYRPIKHWTIEQVFEQHRKHGIEPNPLYRLGMSRVGCLPCINASKDEVLTISKRFPEHIDRIEEWEAIVNCASRGGNASFFPAPTSDNRGSVRGDNIRAYVKWSETGRGGRGQDWIRIHEDPEACASAYGLCE